VEGLYRHAESSLAALGTLDPARPRRLMARLRHLFGRTSLTAAEVDLLRGICRDIDRRGESAPANQFAAPVCASKPCPSREAISAADADAAAAASSRAVRYLGVFIVFAFTMDDGFKILTYLIFVLKILSRALVKAV